MDKHDKLLIINRQALWW